MQTAFKFRLLVVRLGAMGDILHALPAVTALRLAHRDWRIDWVVDPRWRALLSADHAEHQTGNEALGTRIAELEAVTGTRNPGQPLVDTVHFAPAKQWACRPLAPGTFREIRQLRRALRAGGYDAALDFQGAVRSAAIARMAKSGRVIGEAEPREPLARWLFNECVRTRGTHVIEQDLELASAVAGDAVEPLRPLLPIDPEAELWCTRLLLERGAPAVLMNPGAGWGAKRWPPERYGAVAQGLVDRGYEVLVNTGPGEEPLAQVIVQGTKGMARLLMPSVGHLIALTRRVALCIAGDSGPLHLACALGRPVVGIYGPTDPARNGPFGTRSRVLRSLNSRRDHSRKPEPEAGLLTIHPEDVLCAAEELLAGGGE
ncbi:MAG: glycosyltransferase family 9 protein [Terracidiphilus sp.]